MATFCKTVSIVSLIEKVNAFCLNTADDMKAERQSMAMFLADILHQNNVYAGFGYLYAHHMEQSEKGKSVGIIFDESEARAHMYPDESRVYYNVSRKLRDPLRLQERKSMPPGMTTEHLTNRQADGILSTGVERKVIEWLEQRRCTMFYVEQNGTTVIGCANANVMMEFKLAWL